METTAAIASEMDKRTQGLVCLNLKMAVGPVWLTACLGPRHCKALF